MEMNDVMNARKPSLRRTSHSYGRWFHKARAGLAIIVMAALLGGCWSKYELTERAFVMGVAIDLGEDGKLELLTQVYRPSSAEIGKSNSTIIGSSVNIRTSDDTVMEAIRDIPIHLGRKAQWSHMRVIIVGEKLARSRNLIQTLDFFYRDHEPRNSVSLMISKGKAAHLFEKQPLIEQTTSQQFLRTSESSYRNSAKTLDTTLLDLVRQMKSVQKDGSIAYVYEESKTSQFFSAAGLALLKNGVMKEMLPASKVEGLLMLMDKYKSGAVEIPCPGQSPERETAEVLSLSSSVIPKVRGEEVRLGIRIEGEITINELKCTRISNVQGETAFVHMVEDRIKQQASETLAILQKRQIDAIGIGNRVYRSDPKAWSRLKNDWGPVFSAMPADIQVKLRLVTGGTIRGQTMS
jgi:spore germination protein KC